MNWATTPGRVSPSTSIVQSVVSRVPTGVRTAAPTDWRNRTRDPVATDAVYRTRSDP